MPTDSSSVEAELDRGDVGEVEGAVLEAPRRPGAGTKRSACTEATLIVPPANHGRWSFASAARRAISAPTPVG